MIKKALLGVVLAAVSQTCLVSPVSAAPIASSGLALTPPTGRYAVGVNTVHLVDSARADQWAGGPRELMVSVYYPAEESDRPRSPYLSAIEVQALSDLQGLHGVNAALVAATRTYSAVDAPPARQPGVFPLVVMSPGIGSPRKTMSGLAEDVASHGYVVALVDHANEAAAITYPDGRVQWCVACKFILFGGLPKVPPGRAKDVSFLLDRLAGWPNAWMIDWHKIGMAGHSIGGNSAAETMRADPRVLVGANFDGLFFSPVTALDRPFLLVGTSSEHTPTGTDATWRAAWQAMTGPKRWVTLAGANHVTFTDLPLLADQLGFPGDPKLTGARSMEITRGLLVDFLETHLKGRQTALSTFPEAQVWG